MIKVTAYQPEHLEAIRLRDCYRGEEKPKALNGPVFSILTDDGEVMAILGGTFISRQVWSAWGLLSDAVKKRPIAFHKAVKLIIDFWFEKYQLARMQISVSVGYRAGYDWARSLGFNCEGIMKKFGTAGEDCWLFGRVA
jgi:hypothetical protein